MKKGTPEGFMKEYMKRLNLTPLQVAQSTNLKEQQVLRALEGDCSYEVECRICGFLRKQYGKPKRRKLR